jgi:hypothetical protein
MGTCRKMAKSVAGAVAEELEATAGRRMYHSRVVVSRGIVAMFKSILDIRLHL